MILTHLALFSFLDGAGQPYIPEPEPEVTTPTGGGRGSRRRKRPVIIRGEVFPEDDRIGIARALAEWTEDIAARAPSTDAKPVAKARTVKTRDGGSITVPSPQALGLMDRVDYAPLLDALRALDARTSAMRAYEAAIKRIEDDEDDAIMLLLS